ncbi:hypothetical protein VRRI112168_10805 [Vreelandella rituensis]|uniref:hypothetical protein n=1 Tax=Vreelandella rituensis TaxID=2282306 RepID=UPI0015F0F938|nr:hypothetical protein [Halomonas rituensis]
MPDNMSHLSVRVPQSTRDALDELARKRRMESGEDVRLADMVRAALDEYVKRHKA